LQIYQDGGSTSVELDGVTIYQRTMVVLHEIPDGNLFGNIIDYIKLMFHHWFG
ncbi:serine-type D-Ala-D-Ala carboxypeptidase, partial [Klebsiella pneumoniae]|nr:serine-type D-Ala-D-Ala carboxypeptidase [Klebsiella pneumoniae]